jgi:hypothetical protein
MLSNTCSVVGTWVWLSTFARVCVPILLLPSFPSVILFYPVIRIMVSGRL